MRIITAFYVFILSTIIIGNAASGESLVAEGANNPIVIRFSHVVAENTAKGIGAELFKKRVEGRLAGKVQVEIYPRSRKFTDTEVVIGLLFGDVEMAAPSFAKLSPYNKDLMVFDLPFLFPDVNAVHDFQESEAGRKLLDSMIPSGIRGLAYWDNGMRVISANRPVRQPSDVQGLSFRIEPSQLFHRQYSNLGVIPRPMPFSKLTDAIREGLVSGQENTWSNIHSRGVHRYHEHFTELDHSFLGYMVITSDAFWQGLPPEIRDELEQILADVTVEVNAMAAEQAETFRQKVLEYEGVEIIRLGASDKEEWRGAMCEVWNPFATDRVNHEVLSAAAAPSVSRLETAAGPDDTGIKPASYDPGAVCQVMSR